jgi:CubicO group peptidase (beta-lactamase class C family)
MRKTLFFILLVSITTSKLLAQASAVLPSQQASQPVGGAFPYRNAIITLPTSEKIAEWLAQYKVPAVGIAVIEEGKLKQVKVVGKLDETHLAPSNTVFNVASLTKPVVAMLALKMVEAGKLDLDEPLFTYWIDPDLIKDTLYKLLTPRIVLSHQTGFPNWQGENKLAFQFRPGTKYGYSGEGFEYLRRAMEQKSGKTLEVLSREYIFDPLHMKDTHYLWEEALQSRFALWHDQKGKPYPIEKRTEANAADDLLTTVEDYGKFGVDVLKGAGLSPKLFASMISPQVAVSKHVDYGLGWLVVKDLPSNEYALVHSGADKGVRTIIILMPNSQRGIILLTNGDNGHKVMQQIGNEAIDIGKQLISYL